MFLADQEADRTSLVAEGEHGGRAGVNAELVLQADAAHLVAPAGCTVGVGEDFGTRKSEIPLVPGGEFGVRASTRWMMLSARSCSP